MEFMELGQKLDANLSLKCGMRFCLEAAFEISSFSCGGIFLLDESGKKFDLVYQEDFTEKLVELSGRPGFVQTEKGEVPALVSIPLYSSEKIIGRLSLVSFCPVEISKEFYGMLEAIAFHAAHFANRLMMEKKLKLYSGILARIKDNVTVTDCHGNIKYVNNSVLRELGLTEEQVIGKKTTIFSGITAPNSITQNEIVKKTIENGSWSGNVMNCTSDGDQHFRELRTWCILDDDGNIENLGGISSDLTKNKEAEKKVFESAKLSSLGELSAKVGHEILGPLTIVNGYAELLEDQLKKQNCMTGAFKKFIKGQSKAVERIVELVNGLKAFSVTDSDLTWPVDITEVVRNAVSFLRDIYQRDGIIIVEKFPNEKVVVDANQNRLQQMIVNILANAKDALKSNSINDKRIVISVMKEKSMAQVRIVDNGCGIHETVLSRIFDTFFTTKIGAGTGLGLAIVKSIVENANGAIDVRSEYGSETSFTVTFPLTEKSVNVRPIMEKSSKPVLNGFSVVRPFKM